MKKKQSKILNFVLIGTFLMFLTLYLGNSYGYFNHKKNEKVYLTQEQIKQFEQDVKDGKEINLENYLVDTNKSYQTKISYTGLKISNGISNTVKKGVNGFFKSLNKFVTSTE